MSAEIIAGLLEGGTESQVYVRLLQSLRAHVRGRKGRKTSQGDLQFAECLIDTSNLARARKKDQRLTLEACARIAAGRVTVILSGVPEEDWRQMLGMLQAEDDARIAKIVDDARYIRLLRRGSALRTRLNELWRRNGNYVGARAEVQTALTQLHFSHQAEEVRGIHVLTIHKSKGKEFDEVILFESPYQGRYIFESTATDLARARLTLRVGVTRARRRTTVFTAPRTILVRCCEC